MKLIFLFCYLFINLFLYDYFIETFKFSGRVLFLGMLLFWIETIVIIYYYWKRFLYSFISFIFLLIMLYIIVFPDIYILFNIDVFMVVFIFSLLNTLFIYILEKISIISIKNNK